MGNSILNFLLFYLEEDGKIAHDDHNAGQQKSKQEQELFGRRAVFLKNCILIYISKIDLKINLGHKGSKNGQVNGYYFTLKKMARLHTMIIMQGNRNPKRKRNFLGEEPFFLRIVQEKDWGSSPRLPHAPRRGGTMSPKQNTQIVRIMRMTLHFL